MMRKNLLFILLLPILIYGKTYFYPEIKTSIYYANDGSARVLQERTYSFDGSFSWAFIDLKKQLKSYEDTKRPIVLKKTSNANNIMGQFFEVTNNTVSKLDIVEFGHVMNDVKEPSVVTDNVFFAGKIFLDNRGTTCFVNMFTLIFSKLTPTQDQELILASQSARKNS